MKFFLHHKTFARVVLLLWLFISLSGMHEHLCFDGLEPPVSVHFDMVNCHTEHADVAGHADVDSEPAQVLVLKILKLDFLFLVAALLFFILWPRLTGQYYSTTQSPLIWRKLIGLRPPLRAPPILSC